MSSRHRKQLLGYLIGALEADERRAVEAALREDATLRRDLEHLRRKVEPLELARPLYVPPADLLERTCDFVFGCHHLAPSVALATGNGSLGEESSSAVSASLAAARRWSRADMLVVASVCLSMLTLLFPALMHQQQMGLRTACEQNLMRLGNALAHYANANNQAYPPIAASGNRSAAGITIPILFDGGYLDDPSIVLCPASPAAAERAGQCPPTLDQIDHAAGKQLAQLQNRMGGSYGYLMGYMVDRRFQMPRYQSRAYFPIISDAPSGSQPGLASTNHGCRGQNVLFEDNHVRFVSGCLANGRDQMFLNDLGLVAAGVNPEDVVIGRSGASPTVLVPTAGQ